MSEHGIDQDPPEGNAVSGDDGRCEGWFEKPENVDKMVWVLCGLCVASVLADLFHLKHGYYGFQEWIGFDAGYGFIACMLPVLAAKSLRKILMRDEDYYD